MTLNNITPQQMVKRLLRLGFTQKEIAERTGIPQPTINRIKMGVAADPRWSTVTRLRNFISEVNAFNDESEE